MTYMDACFILGIGPTFSDRNLKGVCKLGVRLRDRFDAIRAAH